MDRQWLQMRPGSGFIQRLHERGSRLADAWADGTEWSLVGSDEDGTVSGDSAIDEGYAADQKFRYRDDPGDSGDVTHAGVRTLSGENAYDLTFGSHHTRRGWAPLKAAFQAATNSGDGLRG